MDYPPPPAPIIEAATPFARLADAIMHPCTCAVEQGYTPPPAPRVITHLPIMPPPQPKLVTELPSVIMPTTPPPKRINVRSKGQRGEREVVVLLQDVVDRVREVMRLEPIVLQRNALQAHLGGEDIHGLQDYAVEVKFQEITNVPAWWRQCVAQAEKVHGVPILFYRAKQQKWKVMFRATVRTPKDADDITMDVQTDLESFLFWFECAYMENAIEESQLLK